MLRKHGNEAEQQRRAKTGLATVIFNAGTDAGFSLAKDLLAAGHCVVVTSRYAADLPRIMHGHGSRVLAIAADPSDRLQISRLLMRAENRFGNITHIVYADGPVATTVKTTQSTSFAWPGDVPLRDAS